MIKTITKNIASIPKKKFLKEGLSSCCDIGYNTGAFLKRLNFIPYGIEVNKYAIKQSPQIENISWEDFRNNGYDFEIVSFFDSLEHIKDLVLVRNNLKARFVIISFPDAEGKDFKTWKHYRPNEHLYYFTKDTLRRFMKRAGYELIVYDDIESPIREDITTGIFNKEVI